MSEKKIGEAFVYETKDCAFFVRVFCDIASSCADGEQAGANNGRQTSPKECPVCPNGDDEVTIFPACPACPQQTQNGEADAKIRALSQANDELRKQNGALNARIEDRTAAAALCDSNLETCKSDLQKTRTAKSKNGARLKLMAIKGDDGSLLMIESYYDTLPKDRCSFDGTFAKYCKNSHQNYCVPFGAPTLHAHADYEYCCIACNDSYDTLQYLSSSIASSLFGYGKVKTLSAEDSAYYYDSACANKIDSCGNRIFYAEDPDCEYGKGSIFIAKITDYSAQEEQRICIDDSQTSVKLQQEKETTVY